LIGVSSSSALGAVLTIVLGATLWPDALCMADIYAPILAAIRLLSYVANDNQLRTLTFWNLGNLVGDPMVALGRAMPVVDIQHRRTGKPCGSAECDVARCKQRRCTWACRYKRLNIRC